MKHSWDVKLTLGFGLFIFVILSLSKGASISDEIFDVVSKTISITFFGRLIFIKWIWKWLPFLERLHGVPNIEGKWIGTFQSTWAPDTGDSPESGSAEVKIVQPDIYNLKLTQKTGESRSYSYGEVFEAREDGSIFLNFSFENIPNADVRERSEISFGSARYLLERENGHQLSGNYWTDRKTTGKVTLNKV